MGGNWIDEILKLNFVARLLGYFHTSSSSSHPRDRDLQQCSPNHQFTSLIHYSFSRRVDPGIFLSLSRKMSTPRETKERYCEAPITLAMTHVELT